MAPDESINQAISKPRADAPVTTDFHCHTTASDGSLSPSALLQRAEDLGLQTLSITDHDTVEAYRQLDKLPANLRLIPGIELSCQWQKRGIHIVGLSLDIDSDAIREAEKHQKEARVSRAEMIAEKLEKYGVEAPLEGAMAIANGGSIGRPHFARHMVETGFVANQRAAFKKFLGSGKPCDIKVHWPAISQAVEWIRAAGGVAVLAHPGKYKMTRTKLVELIETFRSCGGEAIEVVSGRQIPSETRDFARLCEQFGLLASWGSDFHSPDQSWLDLGKYSRVPEQLKPVTDRWP